MRVYFDSNKVMNHPEFESREDPKSANQCYFLNEIGIYFNGESGFYIDGDPGHLPNVIMDNAIEFSLRDITRRQNIATGRYEDARFTAAKGEVKPAPHATVPEVQVIEVVGTDWRGVRGLFLAILAGELVPVSYGKSAAEIISDLEAKLDGSLAMIEQQRDELLDTQLRLESAQETIDFEKKQNAELKQKLETRKQVVDVLKKELKLANRSCWRKFTDWLDEIFHNLMNINPE